MSPAPHKSRRIRRRLALFLLLSIFATTTLPQERRDPPATPQVPGAVSESAPKELLTAKDRKEVFEKIWKEIYNHYYDPSYNGVYWKEVRQRYTPLGAATKKEQEFYALSSQLSSELQVAHTRFNPTRQRD